MKYSFVIALSRRNEFNDYSGYVNVGRGEILTFSNFASKYSTKEAAQVGLEKAQTLFPEESLIIVKEF